jgi:hypothetical protein
MSGKIEQNGIIWRRKTETLSLNVVDKTKSSKQDENDQMDKDDYDIEFWFVHQKLIINRVSNDENELLSIIVEINESIFEIWLI